MSTARTLRRAAERRAQKIARKEGRILDTPVLESSLETTPAPISQARLEANQANAQLSTGPRTETGKAASSKNAVKTALTGRTVLLPGDDGERYAARLAEYDKIYQPVGIRETEVVQALCDAWWRLERIPGLIEALYVKGCNELRDRVRDVDPAAQTTMLRIEARLAYERQFRNLELQERRLFRHAEKLRAELTELKKERFEKDAEQYAQAARVYLLAKKERRPFNPEGYGFEFSTGDIELYLEARRAQGAAHEAFHPAGNSSGLSSKSAA